MKDYILAAIFWISFFSLIGFAIYYTESAWPLLALLAGPSVKVS